MKPTCSNEQGCQMVSNQKYQFGYILSLGMDNVGTFYGELEHFTAILYIL
jgi:hypothetical protein